MINLFYQKLLIDPVAAPRQSQRDKWKPSKPTKKFRAFRDYVYYTTRKAPPAAKVTGIDLTFLVPMPKSWTMKKKKEKVGTWHRQTPDIDNLIKAVLDSVYPDGDAEIPAVKARKAWTGGSGVIHLRIYYEDKGHGETN